MTISRWIILKMRSVFDKRCRENQDTQVICSNVFRKSYCLCDNIEKCGGSKEAAVWRLRAACWISKAIRALLHPHRNEGTHTHALNSAWTHAHTDMYNTYCFSTATMVSWTCLIVALYVKRFYSYNRDGLFYWAVRTESLSEIQVNFRY